jgi:BASS family bile acid:Na+ symporter
MSMFIGRYSTLLIILIGIILGFSLPNIGLLWRPYLPYLLMLLMFFVSLTVEPKEIVKSTKNYPVIALTLSMVFIVTPLLSLLAGAFFSSAAYDGTVLAFASPSAIATGFWCGIFSGDVAAALVISTVTNLLAIITMPFTMFLALGTTFNINVGWMMLYLSEMILIPLAASFLLKRIYKKSLNNLSEYTSKVNSIIMMMLIWGSIAPGVATVESDVAEFTLLNLFMLIMLGLAFFAAYGLGKKYGRKQAITIGIAASVKNAALSLILGAGIFGSTIGPTVLPPLIANLIAQNILLVPLRMILKDQQDTNV